MCQNVQEKVYLLAELKASGYTQSELMDRAIELKEPDYSARYLLELADAVYLRVFVQAA